MDFPFESDNFVIGDETQNHQPFEYSLPKVIAYMKETGKAFSDLTEEELESLK